VVIVVISTKSYKVIAGYPQLLIACYPHSSSSRYSRAAGRRPHPISTISARELASHEWCRLLEPLLERPVVTRKTISNSYCRISVLNRWVSNCSWQCHGCRYTWQSIGWLALKKCEASTDLPLRRTPCADFVCRDTAPSLTKVCGMHYGYAQASSDVATHMWVRSLLLCGQFGCEALSKCLCFHPLSTRKGWNDVCSRGRAQGTSVFSPFLATQGLSGALLQYDLTSVSVTRTSTAQSVPGVHISHCWGWPMAVAPVSRTGRLDAVT
jgi:hypothetical protein